MQCTYRCKRDQGLILFATEMSSSNVQLWMGEESRYRLEKIIGRPLHLTESYTRSCSSFENVANVKLPEFSYWFGNDDSQILKK